jgi:transposase
MPDQNGSKKPSTNAEQQPLGAAFKKGRGFAAWLGVVPGEHSTGGKQ